MSTNSSLDNVIFCASLLFLMLQIYNRISEIGTESDFRDTHKCVPLQNIITIIRTLSAEAKVCRSTSHTKISSEASQECS